VCVCVYKMHFCCHFTFPTQISNTVVTIRKTATRNHILQFFSMEALSPSHGASSAYEWRRRPQIQRVAANILN